MKITVEVTAEDIANGKANNCRECPMALAIRRALPGEYIEVARHAVVIGKYPCFKHVHLPLLVREFINLFDGYRDVAPLTFELDDTVLVP